MEKSTKIAIISGVAIAAAISVLAITVHLRLAAIEGNEENAQESTSEKIKEAVNVITNTNAQHNETSESQERESAEQEEKEGK